MKMKYATAVLIIGMATASRADLMIEFTQVGSDLQMSYSGSLDATTSTASTSYASLEVIYGSSLKMVGWCTTSLGSTCNFNSAAISMEEWFLDTDAYFQYNADGYSGDFLRLYINGSNLEVYSSATDWNDISGSILLDGVDISTVNAESWTLSYGAEGYTLTAAVPEPATAGLLGMSCGALYLFRRLKKYMNYYRS